MRLLVVLALALAGCSCGAHPGTPPEHPESAQAAPYEVHEWGLVRAEPGDAMRAGAVAPPVQFQVMAVDKPVLYFHADGPLTLRSVAAEAPEGASIVETWPALPPASRVAWQGVALAPAAGGGTCAASPLPTAAQAPCAGLPAGDQCESTGLAVVRTSDAACVTAGGTTEGFLFYRGRSTTLTPPLVFERVPGGNDVRVTNDGAAPIPGKLVRLWSENGQTRALAVAPPAPHQSVVVGARFDLAAADHPVAQDEGPVILPSTVEPAKNAIRETMLGLGMTAPEADAFLAAWNDALFGRDGAIAQPIDHLTNDALPRDGTPIDGDMGPTESFLYFLPEARTDDVARLSFDPPPRAVHRAIAVWTRLARTGRSR